MPLIVRRLVQLVFVLVGVSTVLFFLLRLTGDPVALMAGENASQETLDNMRRAMGLDQPWYIQYQRFMSDALQLKFGRSIVSRQDAMQLVLGRLWTSLQLISIALLLATLLSIPMGVYAAVKRGSKRAGGVLLVAFLGQSMPGFWLGLLALMIFSAYLHWFPSYGSSEPRHFVLPAATLAFALLSKLVRVVRSGMVEVLNQTYMQTAHAKGLSQRVAVWRHAVKNALIPVVTVLGFDLSVLIGGAVIVETIFSWPGIGRQLVASVVARDYPVVQATAFVVAILIVVVNLAVDLVYRVIDPRVKLA